MQESSGDSHVQVEQAADSPVEDAAAVPGHLPRLDQLEEESQALRQQAVTKAAELGQLVLELYRQGQLAEAAQHGYIMEKCRQLDELEGRIATLTWDDQHAQRSPAPTEIICSTCGKRQSSKETLCGQCEAPLAETFIAVAGQQCGAEPMPSAPFIGNCGAPVGTGAEEPPAVPDASEPSSSAPEMAECPSPTAPATCGQCGAELVSEALFCNNCGARVGAEVPPAPDVSPADPTPLEQPGPESAAAPIELPVADAKAADLETPASAAVALSPVCAYCGAELRLGAHFCPTCGQSTTLPEPAAVGPSEPMPSPPPTFPPRVPIEVAGEATARASPIVLPAAQPSGAPSLTAGQVCHYCGAPMRAGARFCPACGKVADEPVGWSDQLRIHCGVVLAPDMRFCAKCGAEVPLPAPTAPPI